MANLVYNSYRAKQLDGSIDLDTDDIKVMLVTSTYVPSAAHDFRDDITNEVTGTGYTAGGQSLTTKAVVIDGVTAKFTAANVTWTNSTITARGAVLYKSRGGVASADELIGYVDFGSDQSSSNGDFTIQWSANVILQLS